ncbi:DUF1559 family PulG-like putative transporter [Gemmata sp.]|uniref:DUF1559 family PulG-like putative transporter n=1 Tax=Gemmata sp. TaxID=1914242 RepID=UPI003F7192A5
MFRYLLPAAVLVLAVVVVGFIIAAVQKARFNAGVEESINNLRQLAFFAAHHDDPAAKPRFKVDVAKLPGAVPAATVVLEGVPPDERLSWLVAVLPSLDQRRNPVEALLAQVHTDKPWPAPANQAAALTPLPVVLCPGFAAAAGPAPTCYVGVAGVGTDAATLPLAVGVPTPPRAGAFRYDAPTPFERITDGLSQTLLIGESANEPGPWLRGGPSTAREFDDAPGAPPLTGPGGQFGGFFPNATNFALCDGSVRTFTPRTSPEVLLQLATIAGGEISATE